jgi:hypothetical protein
MKRVMSTFPIISLPNFTQPFFLECDPFDEGPGAALMQNQHPISLKGRNIREPRKLYMICDKEILVIMHALSKFI